MLPSHILWVLQTLQNAGHEAYVVGGCVRDMLLGIVPHDFDVCTSAMPEAVLACFTGTRVIKTGLRHGTVTVMAEGRPVEVTTYRVDGAYTDHRRPDTVTFTRSLTADLARRDFTINAMALRPDTGVIDPFGGRADLSKGVIRCVGEPARRFEEDALRILRALRFASWFGFCVAEKTADALLALRASLSFVAAERVLRELCGMDFAKIPTRFLPVLQAVVPEVQSLPTQAGLPRVPAIQLAALLRGLDARPILARLKASRALTERVSLLCGLEDTWVPADAVPIRRLLHAAGPEAARQVLILQQNPKAQALLETVLARGDCYTTSMLALTGADLQALGLAGPAVGAALAALLTEVIEGRLSNEREALLAWVRA